VSIQNGLHDQVRQQRTTLFGPNVIDIKGKSVLSILIDEVCYLFYVVYLDFDCDIRGYPSLLCISNRQHCSLVSGRLLLLCVLYRPDIGHQHNDNSS
jgi:hypothetical protein